jgi:hypothetical protein
MLPVLSARKRKSTKEEPAVVNTVLATVTISPTSRLVLKVSGDMEPALADPGRTAEKTEKAANPVVTASALRPLEVPGRREFCCGCMS